MPSGTHSAPMPSVPRYQPRLSNERAAEVRRALRMEGSSRNAEALPPNAGFEAFACATVAGPTGRIGAAEGNAAKPPRGTLDHPFAVRRTARRTGRPCRRQSRCTRPSTLSPLPEPQVGLEMHPAVLRGEPEAVVERVDHACRDPLQRAGHRWLEWPFPSPDERAPGEDGVGRDHEYALGARGDRADDSPIPDTTRSSGRQFRETWAWSAA